jgi:ankyrin repeat protein
VFRLQSLACRAATGELALPPDPGRPEQHAVVDRLLAAGADPAAAEPDGWAPLHTAAMTGHVPLARRLLAAGAPREGRLLGCRGGSPLALALFYAQTGVAELLADPPVPDNLRHAAGLGRSLAPFLAADGQLSAAAAEGLDFYRPFEAFPEWHRSGSRQELLDEALAWASRNGRVSAMSQLHELGADLNANPYRGTPLLWAVYADRVESASWLIDHGADPDLRHDFGGSGHGVAAVAMHLAAQYGALACLRLLLERGADTAIRDAAHGGTPLDWAEHSGSGEAAALLRARG